MCIPWEIRTRRRTSRSIRNKCIHAWKTTLSHQNQNMNTTFGPLTDSLKFIEQPIDTRVEFNVDDKMRLRESAVPMPHQLVQLDVNPHLTDDILFNFFKANK